MWYNRGEITKGVICIDLKLGKKYKYNQLCSIFNIKPERGSRQKSQLSALREKYGFKIYDTNVNDTYNASLTTKTTSN